MIEEIYQIMTPIVSIIIPSFNRAGYIGKCVKSVIEQTFTDIECIIVDDGSTDNTRQIAEELIKTDSRIKYWFKKHGGVSSARNFGIQKSTGTWIHFLDSDDWIHEDKIRFQLNYVSNLDSQNVIYYSDYERVYIDENQNILKREVNIIGSLSKEQLIERLLMPDFLANSPFPLPQHSMLINKTVLKDKILFNEHLKALEDRYWLVELLESGVTFVYTPLVGAFYTKHKSNTSNNWSHMKNNYILFYDFIHEKHKHLRFFCQPALSFLINETLREKDKHNFDKLSKIIQPPVILLGNSLKINDLNLLSFIYWIRLITPSFLLYEKYRGPRSKKVISTLSKLWKMEK